MKIYLAARYSRRVELSEYRKQLEALGHTVTSRWLDGNHEGGEVEESSQRVELRGKFAGEDFDDVLAADWLIAFTEPERTGPTRGGRHVELGIALGAGIFVTVVGHRENVFCCLPEIEFFESFEMLLDEQRADREAV